MYLKSLTLRGFKSFASSTTLRLEPGITCVVGPNGSGKSNVVDALSWVMGEQGAKSLRGANMSDVIFAGTSGRSPLGRAQVELTIDNSDGRLPIEFSEVTISRTLFRGGGSEYTINGSAVRLLDVQELLSDTGMGKQMHVIVGQGQLDAVLRSTAEERRGFIDEAAGVLKHRRRKDRALRKLEGMDANLVRVLDLTEEIRRQLRPLERQAKAAREAAGVQERIDYAQRRLAADDLISSQRRMERDLAEVDKARGAAAGHDTQIAKLREQVAVEQERGAELQADLQRYTELWHQFDSLQERLSSVVDLSAERLAQAQPRGQQISEAQIELSQEKAEEAAAAARRAEEEVDRQRTVADQSAAARAEVEREVERTTRALRERESALEDRRREIARIRESQVSAASLVEAARSAVNRAEEALAGATERLTDARREGEGDEASAEPLGSESSLAEQHAARATEEQQARRALEELQTAERDARAELASWQARRDALAASLPQQKVDAARTGDDSWKPLGSVEQSLRVSRGWERALSALLIPFEQAPIIGPENSVEQAISRAATTNTALRAITSDTDSLGEAPPPASANGVSLPAMGAVSAPAGIAAALSELLDGAWLADSVGEAKRVLAAKKARVVATTDGFVLTLHSVRGPGEDAVSTLLIRTEWEDARAEADRKADELEQVAKRLAEAREHLSTAASETAAALKRLREHDAEQAKVAQARARLTARISAAEDERRRCDADLAAASARLSAAEKSLEAAEVELAKAPVLDADDFLEEARRIADQAASRSHEAREREMADKLALRTAEEQLRSAVRQADAFRTQAEQLRQTQLEQGRREEVLFAARQRIAHTKARAEQARVEALENFQVAKARKQVLEEQIREAQTLLLGLTRQLEDLQWKQNHADEARQQAEVALAGSRLLYQQHRGRALELVWSDSTTEEEPDQEESLAQLLAEYGPDQPVMDSEGNPEPYQRASMVVRLDTAQKELSRLGVVNPLAVEEHAALSARHEFLVEQVSDLKKSKADLLSIIADVDQRVREAFEDAFAETQAQFERVFGILFPGGRGHLTLTDPDDPLTTGVEIYARPAGKRVTRLSLLSGGERSLAALAYLIAIFQARPSPFYVMDEVEAALDDINLSRVLTVLEELRMNSQLILVTHQKRTMEIADALYGVSMKQGTTAVVSHRLKKESA